MRTGFTINFKREDYFLINNRRMYVSINNEGCNVRFNGKEFQVEDGSYATITPLVDIRFNRSLRNRSRGNITFFCDDAVRVFRSNHPAISYD